MDDVYLPRSRYGDLAAISGLTELSSLNGARDEPTQPIASLTLSGWFHIDLRPDLRYFGPFAVMETNVWGDVASVSGVTSPTFSSAFWMILRVFLMM